MSIFENTPCQDCGVLPGEPHKSGCDHERCPRCGMQLISCGCYMIFDEDAFNKDGPILYGEECENEVAAEHGWFTKWVGGKGWVRCTKDDPEAFPSVDEIVSRCDWDKEKRRFIKRK